MTVFRRLERALAWAAIPNISLWIVFLQVVAYFAIQVPRHGGQPGDVAERLLLIPERVFAGEWWRVFAFLVLPPVDNLFFAFFAWYLFWLFGSSLEGYWGTVRYNLYLWIGWVATVIAALATGQTVVTNGFLAMSVFLAFAAYNPEFELLIFFILPVKIKWLAWLTWLSLVWNFLGGDLATRVTVSASVLNYVLYFALDVRDGVQGGLRRMKRDAARRIRRPAAYRHKCAVCGITDQSHPEAEFRYCSQCAGSVCYCSEHLQSHEHVKNAPADASEASR